MTNEFKTKEQNMRMTASMDITWSLYLWHCLTCFKSIRRML